MNVSLEIGADHRQVRLARLVVAGIATMQGHDVEAIEDLRISVDEGCIWLIEQGDGSGLSLSFAVRADGLVQVMGETARASEPVASVLGDLAAQILAASCLEHRFELDGATARFVLVGRSGAFDGPSPPAEGVR
jgi:hypothetical protein